MAEYLSWRRPHLKLYMHCWWRTLQPSQVKLIVKLSVSPCLDFFSVSHMCLASYMWLPEARWGNAEISPVLRQALLVDTRLGAWPGSDSGCALPHWDSSFEMLKKSGFWICISTRVVLYLLPLLLLCVQWCSCSGVQLRDHDGTLEKEDKKISKFLHPVRQYMKLFW